MKVLDDAELLLKRFPSDVSTVMKLYNAVTVRRERRGPPLSHHLVLVATHYEPSLAAAVGSWMKEPIWVVSGSDELIVMKNVLLVSDQLHTTVL